MTVDLEPIIDQPALRLQTGDETAVIIADLHLGVEHAIADAGVRIPNRTWKIQERLLELIEKENTDRLIILGDVKHTVPSTSWQEAQELPEFFRGLIRGIGTIDIVIGNHDTHLTELLPSEINFHEADGLVFGNVGLFHGHKWPSEDVVNNEVLVLAHNHPTVTLVDELGVSHNYPCWVRGQAVSEKLVERYGEKLAGKTPEVILIPSFLEFGSGTVINEKKREPLGPFLRNGFMDLSNSKVFLVDGTLLGNVGSLLVD